MNLSASFSSASVMPVKLLRKARELSFNGKLRPLHAQISLTNKCNLSCEFCSCSNRDNNQELDYAQAVDVMAELSSLGCQAVTITGGGDPLMHPKFEAFSHAVDHMEISQGLVTNGFLLGGLSDECLRRMVWCRVSASDDRDTGKLIGEVVGAVHRAPAVDWAFSYVVTKDFNPDKLEQIIRASVDMRMTHVRVVSDLIDLQGVPDMWDIQQYMVEAGVDISKVIFQGRRRFTRGSSRCLISLVKPVVAADGQIYPCCGVQYAREDMGLDFDAKMCMGSNIQDIWNNQLSFDGSECSRCYYSQYNDTLAKLIDPLEHEEFV